MKLPVVVAAGWLARIAVVLFSLLNTRLLLDLLGTDGYAALAILLSLGPWLALLNMGLPSAVQNGIARLRADGLNHDQIQRTAVNSTVIGLILFAPLMWTLAELLQRTALVKYSMATGFAISLVCWSLCLNGLLIVFNQVLYALHRGVWPNVMPAVQAATTALLLWRLKYIGITSFREIAGTILVPSMLVFFLTGRAAGAFRTWTVNLDVLGHLLRASRSFLIFAIISTGALSLDYVIMAKILNPVQIVQYNLATKLFGVFLSVHSVLLASSWTSMSELYFSGKRHEMRSHIMRLIGAGITVVCLPAMLLMFWHEPIVQIIGGKNATPLPDSLAIAAWCYLLLRVWSDTFAMAQLSCNQLTTMNTYILIQTLVSVGAQWALGIQYGPTGVVAGMALSFVVTAAWILPLKFMLITRRSTATT